jgi:release factor glutamine methyltransferase
LTVLEAINLSTDYLTKKGVDSARTNAELLLADILKCKRLDLYLSFDRPLDEKETKIYRDYITRRGKREPLQYITGKVEFYGLEFYVNKHVLIPRQETEILVETIINSYSENSFSRILDIGTGTGNISITLAKHLRETKIISIDISHRALEVAAQNVKLSGTESNLFIKQCDVFDTESVAKLGKFDLIVSNPPYVSKNEFFTLQDEIINHEPEMAVTDNQDGYSFYKRISEAGRELLNDKGKIFFEVGQNQHQNVISILNDSSYKNIKTIKDYLQIERVVSAEK